MINWRQRARVLTDRLSADGVLTSVWREAFRSVPRHVFVPMYYRDDKSMVRGDEPGQRREWLDAVYADTSLVTKIASVPGTGLAWAISSSTMPSLMARMLDLLDVADRHRVMEIGTGTAYNAALLCHRMGEDQVATIDIDPELVDTARERLAALGHRPHVVAGDGRCGIPDAAPFDRVIATCAVPDIPAAWITQLDDAGLIVADVRGEVTSSLVTLHKNGPDTATGRFLAIPGHFMWLRAEADNPLRRGGAYHTSINLDDGERRRTDLPPSLVDDPAFRFVMQLAEPDLEHPWHSERDGERLLILRVADGSWAEVTTTPRGGLFNVRQGGPRRLWDSIERTAARWDSLGRPATDRFGMTAIIDGPARFWVDEPGRPWATAR